MEQLEFHPLPEVALQDLITLMSPPKIRRLTPLTKDDFSEAGAQGFVAGKERFWAGFGP